MPKHEISAKPGSSSAAPVPAYLSYSRRNLKLVMEFRDEVALSGLPLRLFYDLDLQAGQAWDAELARQLEQSQLVLFFLSPAALASQYIRDVEVPAALRLARRGRAHVVPVLLSECAWQQTPLAQFMLLPRDGRPLDKVRPRARAWQSLIEELGLLLERKPDAASSATLPAGADRLLLALCAVLDQPAELALLEHLDASELSAVWQQQVAAVDGDVQRALAQMVQRHGQPVPNPLWAAWVATVQPGLLGS
jgi:hypothetical protein